MGAEHVDHWGEMSPTQLNQAIYTGAQELVALGQRLSPASEQAAVSPMIGDRDEERELRAAIDFGAYPLPGFTILTAPEVSTNTPVPRQLWQAALWQQVGLRMHFSPDVILTVWTGSEEEGPAVELQGHSVIGSTSQLMQQLARVSLLDSLLLQQSNSPVSYSLSRALIGMRQLREVIKAPELYGLPANTREAEEIWEGMNIDIEKARILEALGAMLERGPDNSAPAEAVAMLVRLQTHLAGRTDLEQARRRL